VLDRDTHADQMVREHGMTRAQWIILARLERQPDLSQNELAALAEVAPITVARLVDRLEALGLVNVWDNAAMESFFSSLKTERTGRKTYRTRDEARADVFDYIERFYNQKRRHSTIGFMSPMEFERQAGLA
jgi:DNA-binding transcriptional regulator YhcF (GntR family)